MYLSELINVIKYELISGEIHDKKLGKICVDSRLMEENDIFVAIKGDNTDGNNYINEVINKASLIITEEYIKLDSKVPVFKVKNAYKTIIAIGTYNRLKYINKPLIAITGSVGKTTTKELIYEILSSKYNVLKTDGNKNNDLGVPMMLSRINEKHDIIVLELGMNHLNEIKKLSKMCKPNTCIITNIGTSHIGNLKSQENILKAKLEIITGMSYGTLILNGSDNYLNKIKRRKKCDIVRTNINEVSNIILDDKLNFNIKLEKEESICFSIPNKYLIENILLSIMTSRLYNIPSKNIIEKINQFKAPSKRSDIINLSHGITLIDDCYNASFESIRSSLSLLETIKKDKIIIIGDVLELGEYAEEIHKKIENEILKVKYEYLITVGENTSLFKIGKHFNTNKEIIEFLDNIKLDNKVVLIKASRGMHLEEIKEFLEKKYSCK